MKKRIVIALVVLLILAVGGIIGYPLVTNALGTSQAQSDYQTEAASLGSIALEVGGTGTVRANQTVVLAWQTSGTVGKVEVEVGDTVQPGDTLAEINPQTLSQNIILTEVDLINARRSLEQLMTSQADQAQAQLALVNAQKALKDATRGRTNLDRARGSAERIASARAEYYLAKDEVERFQAVYDTFSGRSEEDAQRALALTNLEASKTRRDKALANLNWYLGEASEADFTEADAKVAVAQAQLDDAQREWDRLMGGPDPEDVTSAEVRIAALEATMEMRRLKAPFAATVTEIKIKPGDQASTGMQAFRLDDLSRLLVDVQLSEVDINAVKVNQEVILTFDAIGGKTYHGKVYEVGKVGTSNQGTVNFTVSVELMDADEQVLLGMTAAVNIAINQLNDVLLVPSRAVKTVDGQRVIYVLKNDQPVAMDITLGTSANNYSQITQGDISQGDLVILNPPSSSLFSAAEPRTGGFGGLGGNQP